MESVTTACRWPSHDEASQTAKQQSASMAQQRCSGTVSGDGWRVNSTSTAAPRRVGAIPRAPLTPLMLALFLIPDLCGALTVKASRKNPLRRLQESLSHSRIEETERSGSQEKRPAAGPGTECATLVVSLSGPPLAGTQSYKPAKMEMGDEVFFYLACDGQGKRDECVAATIRHAEEGRSCPRPVIIHTSHFTTEDDRKLMEKVAPSLQRLYGEFEGCMQPDLLDEALAYGKDRKCRAGTSAFFDPRRVRQLDPSNSVLSDSQLLLSPLGRRTRLHHERAPPVQWPQSKPHIFFEAELLGLEVRDKGRILHRCFRQAKVKVSKDVKLWDWTAKARGRNAEVALWNDPTLGLYAVPASLTMGDLKKGVLGTPGVVALTDGRVTLQPGKQADSKLKIHCGDSKFKHQFDHSLSLTHTKLKRHTPYNPEPVGVADNAYVVYLHTEPPPKPGIYKKRIGTRNFVYSGVCLDTNIDGCMAHFRRKTNPDKYVVYVVGSRMSRIKEFTRLWLEKMELTIDSLGIFYYVVAGDDKDSRRTDFIDSRGQEQLSALSPSIYNSLAAMTAAYIKFQERPCIGDLHVEHDSQIWTWEFPNGRGGPWVSAENSLMEVEFELISVLIKQFPFQPEERSTQKEMSVGFRVLMPDEQTIRLVRNRNIVKTGQEHTVVVKCGTDIIPYKPHHFLEFQLVHVAARTNNSLYRELTNQYSTVLRDAQNWGSRAAALHVR